MTLKKNTGTFFFFFEEFDFYSYLRLSINHDDVCIEVLIIH